MGRRPEDCESTQPFSRRYAPAKVERFCSSGKVSIKPPESRIVAADVRRRDLIFCRNPPLHSGGYGGLGGSGLVWALLQVSREGGRGGGRGGTAASIALDG